MRPGSGNQGVDQSAAPVDSPSYRVNFGLFEPCSRYTPKVSLAQSVQNLIAGLSGRLDGEAGKSMRQLIRLNVLQDHIDARRLTQDLEWVS